MFFLPDDSWEIRDTPKKGRGVFAKKSIKPGTIIGDYIGKVIRTAEEDTLEDEKGLYLMYYHDRASLFPVDPAAPGIHLLNHSCIPNCWMYTYRGHTLFFSLRHIFPGEELTIAYLLAPDDDCRPCTHQCHCGYTHCTGSMHISQKFFDTWNDFNVTEGEKTKKARVRYGKVLPLLDAYPSSIPDAPVYTLYGTLQQPPLLDRDHTAIPSVPQLRHMIRKEGRRIDFTRCHVRVLGIQEGLVISERI